MRVLGIKKGKFQAKDTGNWVEYYHLHVADSDKNVEGEAVEILKVSPELAETIFDVRPGDCIDVTYNKFGKPSAIRKVDAQKGVTSVSSVTDRKSVSA